MKNYLLLLLIGLITIQASAQSNYDGTVIDENGEPMVGVNIVLKDTYLGTISDTDGAFKINTRNSNNTNLIFTFVGYETKEVEAGNNMQVSLTPSAIMASEVVVSAVRANKEAPVAYSEMTQEELEKINFGQDLPFLLNQMPSVVTNSDAGAGVGYTNFRIRGTDMSRINVTVNGIPLNDGESQGVFWVNMPDFAASVDKLQVQRGIGTSTNGAASFGASVNLSTLNSASKASAFLDNSYGSFNTWKNSVSASTGLLANKLAFDVRLSRISSDGFIDRGWSDLKSYYFSGGYYGEKTTVKFINFSGQEHTYQAWNGVPKVKLENDIAGMEKLIAHDGWTDEEAANLYASDARTFNRYLYENQTDNYQQDHYQLHFTHEVNDQFNLTAAGHYTRGKGYYESYKYDRKFEDYNVGFDEVVVNGETMDRTDLIQRKWLDNHFYGITFSGNYQTERTHLIVGGAYNEYDGDHYGNVIWAEVNNGIDHNHEWYRNNGLKKDFNMFAKLNYNITDAISLYGDLQYRNVRYNMSGIHDDFADLTQSYNFDFFNPKFGFNYNIKDGHRLFASFATTKREPTRSDFRDAPADRKPRPESLIDYEVGYELSNKSSFLNLTFYYMDYKDQLVLTGQINDVGAPITVNVPESYRTGLEVSGGVVIFSNFNWLANFTVSSNKIKNFTEYVDNWDTWGQESKELGETDIAFSPELTVGSQFNYIPVNGLTVSLISKYVSDQFIDNTSSNERKLDAWFVNDLLINYDFNVAKVGDFNIGMKVNNLFNEEYESNAWVYRYYLSDEHNVLDGYYPQAGTNFMLRLGMKF